MQESEQQASEHMTDPSPTPNKLAPAKGPSSILEIRNQIKEMEQMKFAFGKVRSPRQAPLLFLILNRLKPSEYGYQGYSSIHPLLNPAAILETPKTKDVASIALC